jgi:sulfate transport system substrate-binding protein
MEFAVKIKWLSGLLMLVFSAAVSAQSAPNTILNVSYDVARDLYRDINPAFLKAWKERGGGDLTVNQSHGPSSRQARAVVDGLEADVLTMNQANDLDFAANAGVASKDWRKKFANNGVPFSSVQIFIVRKGNPKNIKDWNDLIRADVKPIIPNPKTAGNGRYTYLAAWGWALRQPAGNEQKARDYVTALFKNVPVLDAGGRGATTTFIQRNIGDVLITFENEAEMIAKEFGRGQFEVVYPSQTILAELPVAMVDKVVDKRGSRKIAQAYIDFLYSPAGQEIAAQNYLRPSDANVLKKYAAQFPAVRTFSVDEVFGGWTRAQTVHYNDGGEFDKIFTAAGK